MGSEYRSLVLGDELLDLLREPESRALAPVPGNVEALGRSLAENLKAQLELYAEYLELAGRQKLALVHGRLAENQDVNREMDSLCFSLGNLETERVGLVERILGHGPAQSPAAVKCEAIYPLLSQELAARLKAGRDALVGKLDQLKSALALNASLVENGSRIIHATIAIMTSVVGRTRQQKMSTYNKTGAVNVGKVQLRNLINRSV